MRIRFSKYEALGNDFLLIEASRTRLAAAAWQRLARAICHRQAGVGADGVLRISASRRADCKVDVYNADGSWAEKSGNGLRIIAAHLSAQHRKRAAVFSIESAHAVDRVAVTGSDGRAVIVSGELGRPEFKSERIPVVTRLPYVVNARLAFRGGSLPVTCVSIGNPHTVLFVGGFDFDWPALGAVIETDRRFPQRSNVEFVRVLSRRKLQVAEWERGVGVTGSSGTGAAAAVCAAAINGLADRNCEVRFSAGSLHVGWDKATDVVHISGPVKFVADGMFEFG